MHMRNYAFRGSFRGPRGSWRGAISPYGNGPMGWQRGAHNPNWRGRSGPRAPMYHGGLRGSSHYGESEEEYFGTTGSNMGPRPRGFLNLFCFLSFLNVTLIL